MEEYFLFIDSDQWSVPHPDAEFQVHMTVQDWDVSCQSE